MITVIADSGSTKTDWALLDFQNIKSDKKVVRYSTQGITPIHQSDDVIRQILHSELLADFPEKSVDRVCFYGSGVRPEQEARMIKILNEAFPTATAIEAHSDLLGAARALCGHHEGVACILGTGANSCLYDGRQIVKNTPALGYILGDEGSGAVLGKRLVHALYSGLLSEDIKTTFEKETKLSLPALIERVYRQPLANRFLASLTEFIARHLDDEKELDTLVRDNFANFLAVHICPYGRPDLPVSFIGSVAWYFQTQLREAASQLHLQVGTIVRSPLEGLIAYHQS